MNVVSELKILPCPFCSWEKIRIIEDEITKEGHCLKGAKYTYCWCKVCGTRGPWAYNVDDNEHEVIRKCIERWNERNGIRAESHDQGRGKDIEQEIPDLRNLSD